MRQPCSIPQSGWMSGLSKCLARQTGWSSLSGRSWYSGSGKISFINCLNPSSNSLLPQQASANREAALLDGVAEVSPGDRG